MIRLGSNSPTRALMLKNNNIDFIQNGGNFDEDSIQTTNPKSFVYQATLGKYKELYEKYGVQDMPLVVADSVVTADGQLLRKAKNKEDARRMLNLQSNNKTSIITCIIYKSKLKEVIDISITTYDFTEFDKEDLEEYLDSGLYKGKAGAIMVEGFCKPYINNIKGFESNAMGLCIEKLKSFISEDKVKQ